ncbi:MAG: PilZ domain-containing protein [Desulfobulbales bacterium]|nr:PilZ domain-containing protein [Desulfobulbales bacterium]
MKLHKKERRKYPRLDISGSVFALLKWNGSELLGSITDISSGGFCLTHIDDNKELGGHSMLRANLIHENKCYENFIARCIWSSTYIGDFVTARVEMKRCGIQFEHLTDELQGQLKEFIATLKN